YEYAHQRIDQPGYHFIFKLRDSRANVALLLKKIIGQVREPLFDARTPSRARLRFRSLCPGLAAVDGSSHRVPTNSAARQLIVGVSSPHVFISDHPRAGMQSQSINVPPVIVVIGESLVTDRRSVERVARRACVRETADDFKIDLQRVSHRL